LPNATQKNGFCTPTIDLSASGIDLSNVTQLTVGLERTGPSGGTGIVFIDDILLYGSAAGVPVP